MPEKTKNQQAEYNISALREEIRESEKVRMDFLKYKLIAVGTIGSIGLGFSKNGNIIILSLIPLVCLFVDILCYHNNLRIFVIASFLKKKKDPYEKFVADLFVKSVEAGKSDCYVFKLEDYALLWSTLIVSLLIFFIGIIKLALLDESICSCDFKELLFGKQSSYFYLIISSLIGIISTIIINRDYKKRKKFIFGDS